MSAAAAFAHLNVANPVLAAPMAGGPSTPALVIAAARAGSLGFLAGGYKTADALVDEIAAVRAEQVPFGVNLFAPNPVPVDPDAFRSYARRIQSEGDHYGLDLAGAPLVEDDDHWQEKIDVLLSDPVPVVAFTFGIPSVDVIRALRRAATVVVQTVTSVAEARQAAASDVDVLVVQGSLAGGHSGTLTPQRVPDPIPLPDLVGQIGQELTTSVVAAGGLATAADISAVLRAGADAVMVGTVLLCTDESGASLPYKAAIANNSHLETLVTRAFTGRPARALPNLFTDRHHAAAPYGYPAIHHLTSPLRKAAMAAGDTERINVWAGSGHRHATTEHAADILTRLADHT